MLVLTLRKPESPAPRCCQHQDRGVLVRRLKGSGSVRSIMSKSQPCSTKCSLLLVVYGRTDSEEYGISLASFTIQSWKRHILHKGRKIHVHNHASYHSEMLPTTRRHFDSSTLHILFRYDSSTAMRFVWNFSVFGINAAQIMAQTPKAILVYLQKFSSVPSP